LLIAAWLGLAFVSAWGEEEETNPKKPLKKIIVPDDGPAGSMTSALPDLLRAAKNSLHPLIKEYYLSLSVPFDRVTNRQLQSIRVSPVPLVFGKDRFPDPFGVAPLNEQNEPGEVVGIPVGTVQRIECFEQIAVIVSENLLNPPAGSGKKDYPELEDRYRAVERTLTQVLFFHENAREQGKRSGKNWEPYRKTLDDKLTKIRRDWVKYALLKKDWPQVRELTDRFLIRYRSRPEILQELLEARLAESETLLDSPKLADLEKVRDTLIDFESRFPGTQLAVAERIRSRLASRAKKFVDEAERKSLNDPNEARNILRAAEALDPDDERARKLRQQLRNSASQLVVAIDRIPEFGTPTRARYESERYLVDLLFEGLLESVPDESLGELFQPRLIRQSPNNSARGRTVQLAERAFWSRPEVGIFDVTDLEALLRRSREPASRRGSPALAWIESLTVDQDDPRQVDIHFSLPHPDPRQLLGVKLLPARWLDSQQKPLDDVDFARFPFGTGPYRLMDRLQTIEPGKPIPQVVLQANPLYGRRFGQIGTPGIQEVRLILKSTLTDPVGDFRAEQLHLIPDLPTQELDQFANIKQVQVVTPRSHQRIHYLAVNHRSPVLQNVELRRGLNHALDREAILDAVYRAGKKEYHQALRGPFPVNTWLVPSEKTRDQYQPEQAEAELQRGRPVAPLSLLFPNDDPLAQQACDLIKKQIEAASTGKAGKVTIELLPVAPADLYRRVEHEHRYDLAYMTHTYDSCWFAHELAVWLDPTAASPGGMNHCGYLAKATLPHADDDALRKRLIEVQGSRDPVRISKLAIDIHQRFGERVPFIPLWQLDRHLAVSTRLKMMVEGKAEPLPPQQINPGALFRGVARWRLE
jgi:ABC-type transport system substrate-binding protein